MSDPKVSPPAPAQPGKASPVAAASAVASGPAPARPPAVSPAAQSVPLFGGHRGGGKRRKDGLAAGSPEALAADREKDRERKRAARAAGAVTPVPAPLPSAAAVAAPAAPDAAGPVADGASPVPVPAAGAGVALVLWNPRLLEKPAKLITRIIDRVRSAALVKKLDHPRLPAEFREECVKAIQLPPEALADFAHAMADCAAVEFNKRGVGAAHSHWLSFGGCIVEVCAHTLAANDRIDRLISTLEAEKPAEAKAEKI